MRRRDFIAALSATPLMWSTVARAQRPPGLPLIGYLDGSGLAPWYEAFRLGLNDLGYAEGKSIAFEHRSADGRAERLPALAAELVDLKPKVIVASGSSAAVATKAATTTIPIVFAYAIDPLGLGLVASLSRPGGNATGLSNQAPGLVGKRLQLLAETAPGAASYGVVWTPSFAANHADFADIQAAAVRLGLKLISLEVARPADIEPVFSEAASRTGGVAVLSGPLIFANREPVTAAAARHKVPAIYYDDEYADAGGLLAYGPSLIGLHRSAAVYVDRILKGETPADLPVEQPTRFSLVVNMKAARMLGLAVPSALLILANRVIE